MTGSTRVAPWWRGQAIALAASGAALATLMLGGCVKVPLNSQGTVFPMQKSATSAESSSAVTTQTAPAMIGKAQSGGSWKVAVLRARAKTTGPGGMSAGSGKQWLLVETEFRNIKLSESLFVNPKDATLTSRTGKKYATSGTNPGYNGHGMRFIGPGLGSWTVFAFKVPKGSTGYTFTFSPKTGGKRLKLQWGVP